MPDALKNLFHRKFAAALLAIVAVMAVVGMNSGATRVVAQSAETVRIVSSSVESEFPEGIRFKLDLESELRIDDVRVTLEIGARGTTLYSYLDLDNTTLFCQDWGSLIGIRVLIDNLDRFQRLIVANGGLATGERSATDAFK
ncbi:MAG: hypothetical protein QF357_11355, partial [Dehalococcoidia bacterium]|nr:hypothetical protein [Dehalococcoidia bacterium]